MYLEKPLPIKKKYLSTSLVDYLHINVFPDLMVVEQEGVYLEFYKQNSLEEPRVSGVKTVGWTQWDLTLETLTLALT